MISCVNPPTGAERRPGQSDQPDQISRRQRQLLHHARSQQKAFRGFGGLYRRLIRCNCHRVVLRPRLHSRSYCAFWSISTVIGETEAFEPGAEPSACKLPEEDCRSGRRRRPVKLVRVKPVALLRAVTITSAIACCLGSRHLQSNSRRKLGQLTPLAMTKITKYRINLISLIR
jgi:hypothetical protein